MLLQILLKMVNCWDELEDEALEVAEAEGEADDVEALDEPEGEGEGEQEGGEERLGGVDGEGPPLDKLPRGPRPWLSADRTSPSLVPSPAASWPLPSRQPSTSAQLLTTASSAADTMQEQMQGQGHGQGRARHAPTSGRWGP